MHIIIYSLKKRTHQVKIVYIFKRNTFLSWADTERELYIKTPLISLYVSSSFIIIILYKLYCDRRRKIILLFNYLIVFTCSFFPFLHKQKDVIFFNFKTTVSLFEIIKLLFVFSLKQKMVKIIINNYNCVFDNNEKIRFCFGFVHTTYVHVKK